MAGFSRFRLVLFALAPLLGACAWVSLTDGGREVQALRAAEATECRKIGQTTSQTTHRILIFGRSQGRVQEELDALAKNEAAEMGGDAIVPRGSAERGRQTFDVYRCRAS